MDRIGKALENLVLAASNDITILQQLTVANLALTALVTSLMAANKKLANAMARNKGGAAPATPATSAAALLHQGLAQQPGLSQATIAGPMVTRSIRPTQVQPALSGHWDTRRT
jgi:hypothetical protein